MTTIDRIVSTVRHWPYAIEHGTYHHLFERRDNLREQADGPPIYDGGGHVFRPTGELLTAEQYRDVCDLLEAPAEEPDSGPEPENSPTLTPADRRRNNVRGRAEAATRRAGGY